MPAADAGFFEIVIGVDEMVAAGFSSREEIEEPIQELLESEDIGEVSGGGAGSGVVIIDVDVFDASRTDEAIALVVEKLRTLKVPRGTRIEGRQPERNSIPVW